jgi:hypothetical protein
MPGFDFIWPHDKSQDTSKLDMLPDVFGSANPYFSDSPLSKHLFNAMWYPATYFSLQNHINIANGQAFKCLSYFADDPDVIANCVARGDGHVATVGAPFVRRLVKICDRLDAVLQHRPRIPQLDRQVESAVLDPLLSELLSGDRDVSESEALDIVSSWPDPDKESHQVELGPFALFYDMIRLIWVHEWAHALIGHARFVSRDLHLVAFHEFSADRAAAKMHEGSDYEATEVFQALELHADEFSTRYNARQILWGHDPIGRLAGPNVDLIDRLLIFNIAFCVFATVWLIAEQRFWPGMSFYPHRRPLESNEPEPLFEPFTTTHPPAALRYLRFRGFQRDLTYEASADYGPTLSTSVDAVSFNIVEILANADGRFYTLSSVTPLVASTPTMKRLDAYEAHLLAISEWLAPKLAELGYRPTTDPLADYDPE